MTKFLGFKTLEEAKAYQKEHGGYLCYEKLSKNGKPTGCGYDYEMAVVFGGLDKEKYPYCLQWSNR